MSTQIASKTSIVIHAMTDVGKSRAHNEDNFIVCPNLEEKRWYVADQAAVLSAKGALLVVADGMGGANAGEVASEIAVEIIRQKFEDFTIEDEPDVSLVQDYLYQAIMSAHKAILSAARENSACAGMGTTILLAWVFADKVVLGWSGDSRAYVFNKKQGLQIITKDHSLVWEMVENGQLTPDEADVHPDNNIITQSLGDRSRSPRPDFTVCKLSPGDRLLLCSDGLNNMVGGKEIEAILRETPSVAAANEKLIEAANRGGGQDNITVVAMELADDEQKQVNLKPWLLGGLALCLLLSWFVFMNDASAPWLKNYWHQFTFSDKQEQTGEIQEPEEVIATTPSTAAVAVSPLFRKTATEYEQVLEQYVLLDSLMRLQQTHTFSLQANGGQQQEVVANYYVMIMERNRLEEAGEMIELLESLQLGVLKSRHQQHMLLDSLTTYGPFPLSRISERLIKLESLIKADKQN